MGFPLGTFVLEETPYVVIGTRLTDGQITIEWIRTGPAQALPNGKHHYAVLDADGNFVVRGLTDERFGELAEGQNENLILKLDVGSSADNADKRLWSLQAPSVPIRDERETIAYAVSPSDVSFLGYRTESGELTDTPLEGRPRVYEVF